MSTNSTCAAGCPGRAESSPIIPTPDEFERLPKKAPSTGTDQVVRAILDELNRAGKVPAVVNVTVSWLKAPYVTKAIERFQAQGWRVDINKTVTIFGYAIFDLVMAKPA